MSDNMSVGPVVQQYDYKNVPVSSVGGSIAGALTGSYVVPLMSAPIGVGVINKMHKMNDLPVDTVQLIHNAAERAINDAGLAEHGVKIKYIPEVKPESLYDKIMGLLNPIKGVEHGNNAFAVIDNKAVYMGLEKGAIHMPENKLSSTVFHEIGHQMNANLSKIGPILQKCRPISMYAPAILALYGAFTQKSEPQNGKDLTDGQKAKNFVRNNIGKLVFISTLPMLIEEGMASIKGNKLAKKVLSEDMAKMVGKGNSIAYLSYLASAIFASLGAWAAVKIKDKAIEKKREKIINQMMDYA